MIKAVIFDLDNTLYSFDDGTKAGVEAFAKYCVEELGIDHDDAVKGWKDAMDEQRRQMTDFYPSVHNRSVRAQLFLRKRGISDIPHAAKLAEAYWNGLMDSMVPEEGIEELFSELKKNGLKIAVGTNMTAYVQNLKLERLGLGKYVDYLISSEEAMYEKPTKGFFEYLLQTVGVNADEAVFIGDSIEHDIDGAKTVNMPYAWYTGHAKDKDYERAEKEAVNNRIASYKDCIREDGSIKLGEIGVL